MPRAQVNRTVSEVIGLVLLGLGTLLLFSLVSYTPKDLPGWFPLSHITPSNHPAQNFIGPAGAILASIFYFLFGAASYLVAAVLLGYGGAKLISPGVRIAHRLPWVAAFIVSGACLAQLQHAYLQGWPRLMNISGPGGWCGYWLGDRVLQNWLGYGGSHILLICLYIACVIIMTGIRPFHLLRKTIELPGVLLEKYRQRQMALAGERERLELEHKKLEREAKKLERQLSKKGVAPAAPESSLDEEIIDRPAPQIIDTAMATPKPAEKSKLIPKEPVHFDNYTLPELDLLDPLDIAGRQAADPEELRAIQDTLIETLAQFGITVAAGDITKGPTITRYEVYPAKGVRVDKIVSLERDIARATRAERINILAPIPGKDTVGIEIANSRKVKVTLRELLETEEWHATQGQDPARARQGRLWQDDHRRPRADAALPRRRHHRLAARASASTRSSPACSTGSRPSDLRFIMIDPKVVEMQIYNTLPHLVIPVVTDPKKVLLALRWVIDEMEKRYKIFAKTGVRNIATFNARPKPKTQKELDAEKKRDRGSWRANEEPVEPKTIDVSDETDDELFDRRRACAPSRSACRATTELDHPRPHALHRRHHRRAGRPHADRAGRCRERHRPHHADGARRRHPHDRRHADAARRRHHRRHQGQHPEPHRLPGRERDSTAASSSTKTAPTGCSARATCFTCRPAPRG